MPLREKPTAEQVENACLSYRHDFGLLSLSEQEVVRGYCRCWWEAIAKSSNRKSVIFNKDGTYEVNT